MPKSPELKAAEKRIKEEQKYARETARREHAKSIVDGSKYIGDFRIMIPEAEGVLSVAIDTLNGEDKFYVSVSKEKFMSNIRDNLALFCEALQLYGMITDYLVYGQYVNMTLSEKGKTYFQDKGKAEKEDYKMQTNSITNTERKTIFLSHRSVDAQIADMIKDFFVNTGIPNDLIFCSSLPGNDVNERIAPEVKQRLRKSAINILILSKDYYNSAYCLNEAGIAWFLDEAVAIPIGLPEIDHRKMIGFLNSEYKLRRLDNDDDISYLYDVTSERLNVKSAKHAVITREAQKLKDKYSQYITNRKEEKPLKNDEMNQVNFQGSNTLEKDEGILLVYAVEGQGEIIVTQSITRSGPSVQAGNYDFTEADTPRECAKWKEALNKLESLGLVENVNNRGEIYTVTAKGFDVSDQIKTKWAIDVNKPPKCFV